MTVTVYPGKAHSEIIVSFAKIRYFIMLDNPTIDYILSYYSNFMTLREIAAMKHYSTSQKFDNTTGADKKVFFQKGWLSTDREVLDLLKDGYEQFRVRTATRIFHDHKSEVYFNLCPKCEKLARTPLARQCRYCGHDWHSQ